MTPIDVLNDDILLAIFDFYVAENIYENTKRAIESWQKLVHVCSQWRCITFASPRRLDLRLVCTPGTPVRETLDVWPALPLIVDCTISSTSVDNIVVALGHSDRVCRIDLQITAGLQWDKVLAAMQVPFPALTCLLLYCDRDRNRTVPIIPDTFLGGSAPRLRYLKMYYTAFPGIPNLLLSATHLMRLDLSEIPLSGYISPKAMATFLSELTSLYNLSLSLGFSYSRSRRRPPPMTRPILPGLTTFRFNGVSEYLDDLVARIDAPRLDNLSITFPINQINFDTPHLVQFISRTPRLQEPNEAHVILDHEVDIRLLWASDDHVGLHVEISCSYEDSGEDFERPGPSSIAQICTMCLPPLPTVESLRLEVFSDYLYSESVWEDNVEKDQWLELLRPFSAVKSLYISKGSVPGFADALKELIGSRATELLPRLLQENIEEFIPPRPFSGPMYVILD